jgi:hypothetical protein
MKFLAAICLCGAVNATAQTVQPRIVSEPAVDGHVTVVEVRTHFVTAIRMPEPVNSVAVGDPTLFQVEHSEREPNLVLVKAVSPGPAESNLLVSAGKGHETSLLLVSRGENAKDVDFVVSYRRAGSFLIEPDYPSPLVGETVPTTTARVVANPSSAGVATGAVAVRPVSLATDPQPTVDSSADPARRGSLDELLTRQRRAPLPALYGEHPGVENPAGDHVRAGVSEVIDGGQQVIVLFSAVNPTQHAILLVPPQVQLGGKSKGGKLHHSRWTTAEQLAVEDFRLSTRRLAPGERADGVVLFERPPYKQSSETLLLQVAEAGAVDKPALAPIGFGVNKLREEAADGRAK